MYQRALIALCAASCVALGGGPRARAQSYFARVAALHADGVDVGTLGRAPIEVTQVTRPTHLAVHFEDETITIDADVALDDDGTVLLAGVGQPVTLYPRRSFRIDMSSETYARLRSIDRRGRAHVLLPHSLPYRHAVIPADTLPATTVPQGQRLTRAPEATGWDQVCSAIEIVASRAEGAPTWVLRPGGLASIFVREGHPDERGWRDVRVWYGGFVVHGVVKREVPRCMWGYGMTGGSSCAGGFGPRVDVSLPPGTTIAARAGGAPFATLHVDVIASAQAASIPDTPLEWMMSDRDDRRGPWWSLSGYVSLTPEELRERLVAPSP